MARKSFNIDRLWRELKRRKVTHVITGYAATAFVILQLVDIVAQPLQLPTWTLTFLIIILCVGFPVVLFLSWNYDFTAAGVIKTEPDGEAAEREQITQKVVSVWQIATYVSIIIIIALIGFNFATKRRLSKDIMTAKKSIAVLPFKLISDEPDKQYLADGIMEAILLHLSKIKDLRVISRTSMEQYRYTNKTIPAIGQELDAEFLLEGSLQTSGEKMKLIVQLIKTKKENHLWANEYNRNWIDVFSVQSEVAQEIAGELNVFITPQEKQLIDKKSTLNLAAYDLYQKGRENYLKFLQDNNNREALEKAEISYRKALEYDSTYAQAYTGLALVYKAKSYWETFFTEGFLDSTLIFANIAHNYDDKLSEVYTIRGEYYRQIGKAELAIKEYDHAIQLNPNDWTAYYGLGVLYWLNDLVKAIDNFQKAAALNRGAELPGILRFIGFEYNNAGFREKSYYYWKEALALDGDSSKYYNRLYMDAANYGNFKKAIEYANKMYSMDSADTNILIWLVLVYTLNRNYEESLKYLNEYIQSLQATGETDYNSMWIWGYIYLKNGFKEKAEYYFNETIKNAKKMIELGRAPVQQSEVYYDLAAVYAFRGDKQKAYENLRILNKQPRHRLWIVTVIKNDPLFDSIRDEPEFKQIVRDIEAKFQTGHEQVRKWLEERGEL